MLESHQSGNSGALDLSREGWLAELSSMKPYGQWQVGREFSRLKVRQVVILDMVGSLWFQA